MFTPTFRKTLLPATLALFAVQCTLRKTETTSDVGHETPVVTALPAVTPAQPEPVEDKQALVQESPASHENHAVEVRQKSKSQQDLGLGATPSKPKGKTISVARLLEKRAASALSTASAVAPMALHDRACCPSAPMPMVNEADNESYATIRENGFLSVTQNPLSTFSIDVDQASYANMRRFLNQGQMPPSDAVRIEELINYFPYAYAKPQGEHPFSITLDMGKTPWNAKTHLVLIGLKARDMAKAQLPPQNLTFLVDVSGSMHDAQKLPLLKKAFGLLVDQMRPQDKVSLAVYAGAAGVVLPPTSGANKEIIRAALDNLSAGGSTAGGAGLRLAYQLARESFSKSGNNRVILATDGDFNVGETSDDAMEKLISTERESGIFLSVLGFGMGNYKDSKMERLADKGNGNYAYIDNLLEARKVLVEQMGGTLQTVAKDVKLQVEWNPARVSAYRLIGYENRLLRDEDFNDDTKDAGEIGAGHTVTALYEVLPAGSEWGHGQVTPKIDPLKYGEKGIKAESRSFGASLKPDASQGESEGRYAQEVLTVKFRYKAPAGKTSQLFSEVLKASDTRTLAEASENLRFASAVAGFGMLLRHSEHRGDLTYDQVAALAEGAKRFDPEGYRAECIRLMRLAEALEAPVQARRAD